MWIILGLLFFEAIFINWYFIKLAKVRECPIQVPFYALLSFLSKGLVIWTITNGSTIAMLILSTIFLLDIYYVNISNIKAFFNDEFKLWILIGSLSGIIIKLSITYMLIMYGNEIWIQFNTPLNQLF